MHQILLPIAVPTILLSLSYVALFCWNLIRMPAVLETEMNPVLWRKRHKPLSRYRPTYDKGGRLVGARAMWARVLLALYFLVSTGCERPAAGAVSAELLAISAQPKSEYPSFPKSIADCGLAPHKYRPLIVFQGISVCLMKLDSLRWSIQRSSRPDNRALCGPPNWSEDFLVRVRYADISPCLEIISRCTAGVSEFDPRHGDGTERMKLSPINRYIGPQLSPSDFVSTFDELLCCPPQQEGGPKQQSRESSNQGVGNFQPIAKQRRPELGSLFFVVIGFGLAFLIADRGADLWEEDRRWLGGSCLVGAALLVLQGTFGLLIGLDWWSLLRLL